MKKLIVLTVLTLHIYSCKKGDGITENIHNAPEFPTLFTLLDSTTTGINFINTVENTKEFNIFNYRNFYNGAGVAIGDINNDGLADIYLTSNLGSNKLYLNKGGFKFEDITTTAGVAGSRGWSTGVVMVDINGDGYLDIYVCNAGNVQGDNRKNELFINDGHLNFTEEAEKYNLDDSGFTTHAAFFDYDRDGDLDVYILNNSFIPANTLNYSNKRELRSEEWNVPDLLKGGGDKLLRNDNGHFTDVSKEAGIYGSLIGFGLGVSVGDVNGDRYPDIYVSNDFYERDYLYINNRNGTFTEDIKNWTTHLSYYSMGADMADINNDGKADIFVTDMLAEEDKRQKQVTEFERYDVRKLEESKDFYHQFMQNTLHLNTGDKQFSEVANFSGVAKTDWSWGALLFDMDNDGYKDIYVSNGINYDLTDQDFIDFFANEFIQKIILTGKKEAIDSIIKRMPKVPVPNYAFRNNRDLTFTNETEAWGFNTPSFSNGSAYGDLDNDGDLDLVVNNVNMPMFIYENNTNSQTKNNFLKLKLRGKDLNTFGIGSIVEIYTNNGILRQELMPSRGFQSSVDYIMTIGLGDITTVDSLKVIWPDDSEQLIKNSDVNTMLELDQNNAAKTRVKTQITTRSLFAEIPNTNLNKHQENNFVDFDYEGLINKMVSREGPTISVADINNDGNDDLFIGGGKNQAGTIYLNKGNGKFTESAQTVFNDDMAFEDTASAFFDADNDGDIDLIVGTGGNESNESANYINRLYLNDGKGKYSRSSGNVPSSFQNTSVIITEDFDSDGDQDIFIGSRSVPNIYGVNPKQLLLENDGKGNFKDITESKAFDLKNAGMVTDAKWADIDGDKLKDLVLVVDWGTPLILKNSGRRLSLLNTTLSETSGWWNTVETADLDNDGDQDLILGNSGSNIPYKASKESPLKLYINDFDNNGTIEQIMTQSVNGKDTPIHMKKELTSQIVLLKKQNLTASEYATKSIQDLFDPEILNNSIVKKVTTTNSVVAMNQGNGDFEIKILPYQVQFSCICGIACEDIDNDGNVDLLMGGNSYEFKPQFSRLDSNYGGVLLNKGNGNFSWEDHTNSGFYMKGEVKHLVKVKDKQNNNFIVAVINNEKPRIFKLNE